MSVDFERYVNIYILTLSSNLFVLGLAGMELIFFIASPMVVCFRLVTKTVGYTPMFELPLNSASTASRPLFFILLPQRVGWG